MATSPHFHVPSELQKTKLEAFNKRDADIFESGLAVRPENPHFVWRLKTQKINDVSIPKIVLDCYQLKIPKTISVVDERGKQWDVKTCKESQGRTVCYRTEWRRLCEANHVGTGDACICEFMQRDIGVYIRLHVIRANELRRRDIFGSGLAVEPENPYLVWRSTCPENIKTLLYIPRKLVRRFNLKTGNGLTLVDERGNKWETHFVTCGAARLGCSNTGWRKLCDANTIRIGDRCICEFIQESSGLAMHVRVVRDQAHILTRKKGVQEEAVEQVDEESTYENVYDENVQDGSWMQRNTVEGKHKLNSAPLRRSLRIGNTSGGKKGFEEDNCAETEKEIFCSNLPNHNGCDEYEGDESGTEMNLSKGKRKLRSSSSHAPVRRIARKDYTVDRKKVIEEEKIKQIDKVILDLDSSEESGWKTEDDSSEETSIESSECLREKLELLQSYFQRAGKQAAIPIDLHNDVFDKEIFCSNLPNHNGCDENDEDESGTEMNLSKGKRKLRSSSSHAPVRRSARKENTLDRKKVIEEEKIKQIDKVILDLDSSEESGWKTEDDSLEEMSIESSECLPEKLELLQSYFQRAGKKAAIPIDLHNDVFGKEYKICILFENVKKFCLLEPIADCCIISYMWYLHRKMKTENLLHRFQFVNPTYLSHKLTGDERARALADRLIGASTDQLVLAPCNVGFHWILTVIEPYKKNVFLLDPLSHRIRDETWRDAVNKALSMFSASKGDKRDKLSKWVIVKAHLQPDSKQCGFYIMRYMKQIIEACRDRGSISLQSMFTKEHYSTSEIDEMRIEWAECILDHIG